uniref:DUF1977 domain-containing protein n=1 Tax=Molossus molossus TaxID=27622 RepID=A0A7J8GQW3_MOLMO|nr:hypothetical protein HJG59_011358 [Molossus molossus]
MSFGGGFPPSNAQVYSNGRRTRCNHQQRQDRRENRGDGAGGICPADAHPRPDPRVTSQPAYGLPSTLQPEPEAIGGPHSQASHWPSERRLLRADTFSQEYTGSSLQTVERNVEDDDIANLRNNCRKEKQQKEGLLYRARCFSDTDLCCTAEEEQPKL